MEAAKANHLSDEKGDENKKATAKKGQSTEEINDGKVAPNKGDKDLTEGSGGNVKTSKGLQESLEKSGENLEGDEDSTKRSYGSIGTKDGNEEFTEGRGGDIKTKEGGDISAEGCHEKFTPNERNAEKPADDSVGNVNSHVGNAENPADDSVGNVNSNEGHSKNELSSVSNSEIQLEESNGDKPYGESPADASVANDTSSEGITDTSNIETEIPDGRLKAQINDLDNQVERLNSHINEQQKEIDRLKPFEKLSKSLNEKLVSVMDVSGECFHEHKDDRKTKKLQETIDKLKESQRKDNEEIINLKREIDKMKDATNKQAKRITYLEVKNNELDDKNRETENNYCSLIRSNNDRFQEHREKMEKDISMFKSQLEIQQQICSRINQQLASTTREKEKLDSQKKELLLRLSKVASANLTLNNPNIADLSDENRPTKLAEAFSELYDNEWTDAFEKLDINDEKVKNTFLFNILKRASSICYQLSDDHMHNIKKGLCSLTIRSQLESQNMGQKSTFEQTVDGFTVINVYEIDNSTDKDSSNKQKMNQITEREPKDDHKYEQHNKDDNGQCKRKIILSEKEKHDAEEGNDGEREFNQQKELGMNIQDIEKKTISHGETDETIHNTGNGGMVVEQPDESNNDTNTSLGSAKCNDFQCKSSDKVEIEDSNKCIEAVVQDFQKSETLPVLNEASQNDKRSHVSEVYSEMQLSAKDQQYIDKEDTHTKQTDIDKSKSDHDHTHLSMKDVCSVNSEFNLNYCQNNYVCQKESNITKEIAVGTDNEYLIPETVEKVIELDFDSLENDQKKAVIDLRKNIEAKLCDQIIMEVTYVVATENGLEISEHCETIKYIKKCVNICWSMCKHEPSVYIHFPDTSEEQMFDSTFFKPYTKSGKYLEYIVWPAVYLHKDGPILCKGVAQAK